MIDGRVAEGAVVGVLLVSLCVGVALIARALGFRISIRG